MTLLFISISLENPAEGAAPESDRLLPLVIARDDREAYIDALVGGDVFQINYQEDEPKARQRFEPWLENNLAGALALWRESL